MVLYWNTYIYTLLKYNISITIPQRRTVAKTGVRISSDGIDIILYSKAENNENGRRCCCRRRCLLLLLCTLQKTSQNKRAPNSFVLQVYGYMTVYIRDDNNNIPLRRRNREITAPCWHSNPEKIQYLSRDTSANNIIYPLILLQRKYAIRKLRACSSVTSLFHYGLRKIKLNLTKSKRS